MHIWSFSDSDQCFFFYYHNALYNLSSLSLTHLGSSSKQSHIWRHTVATTNRSADREMLLMSWRLSGNFPRECWAGNIHTAVNVTKLSGVRSLERDQELLVNRVSMRWTLMQIWTQLVLLFGHLHSLFPKSQTHNLSKHNISLSMFHNPSVETHGCWNLIGKR